MKILNPLNPRQVSTALAILGSLVCAHSGNFFSDFDSGLPANSTTYGNAAISANDGTGGGYTNSGCLQLTTATASQTGSFVITNDLDAGVPVVSFIASFKVLIGGGSGADDFSFNFAPDLPQDVFAEEGAGSGLTVEFDTFGNGAPDTAPSIDIKVGGLEYVTSIVGGLRAGTFVDAVIQLNPNNTLDVVYDGVYVYSNLDLKALDYAPVGGSLFGLGSRTGGLFDNHFIDELQIVTQTSLAPYVQSFAPRGRNVQTNAPIELVLTDHTTQVAARSIAVKLDGVTVAANVAPDGSGDTVITFAPSASYGFGTTHIVSVTYADNGTPAHQSSFQYSFATAAAPPVVGNYDVVFADGFEAYVSANAPLDKNLASGANAAANGSGNPWFGPAPPNARVVGAEVGVTPHTGTNMITGSAPSDGDQNWYNLAYRLRRGQVFYGNFKLDWWFYDPSGAGDTGFRDYLALGFYNTAPTTTDYPGAGSLNSGVTQVQRVSLGAGNNTSTGFDNTKYQARVVGGPGYASGWVNLALDRSIGWHHARIIAGAPLANNTANLDFYIDDMIFPLYSQNSVTTYGFNVIEINTGTSTTLGYFDDVSFALEIPPNPTATQSGSQLTLTWPLTGFTLQSAPSMTGPWTDVAGATSPHTHDTSVDAMQFFRLRN